MVDPNRFRAEYTASLRQYLNDPGEAGLVVAYELGRRAVREQLSVLELSAMHHEVIAALASPSADRSMAQAAKALAEFFGESLSAFEMVQRGFGEVQKIAFLEKQYADQLRLLAEGSTAINATFSIDKILAQLAELAAGLVDGELCIVVTCSDASWSNARLVAIHPPSRVTLPSSDRLAYLHDQASRVDARPTEPLRPGDDLVAVLAWPEGGGGLVIVQRKKGGTFTDRDASVLLQVAQTCSVAIERSQLYTQQSAIAETLQRALLPESLPTVPGLDIATRYLPGGGGSNVGGDWFDVIDLGDGRVGLAIGDVAGHGVQAASEMGQVRTAFRAYAMEHGEPAPVVSRMGALLHSQNTQHFSTMAYLLLARDRRTMQLARAGHLSPLIIGVRGPARYVNEGLSPPLGAAPRATYKQATVPLSSGDIIVLFTDGVLGKQLPDLVLAKIRTALKDPPSNP